MTEEKQAPKRSRKGPPTDEERAALQAQVESARREVEETKEGAPEVETPEAPKSPPKGARRDEESPVETPEKPAVPQRSVSKESSSQVEEEAAPAVEDSELEDLYVSSLSEHISAHPVDAHAPVWKPRTPNTTGGYS